MAIIKDPSLDPRLSLPLDKKKTMVKDVLGSAMNKKFRDLVDGFNSDFNYVWNNPLGLTPQQVMDAFGTEASQLFVLAGATADFINSLRSNTIDGTPPKAFTINQDGTVTITE